MFKYLTSKLLIFFIFIFLIGFPFFCAAIVFKSKILWTLGVSSGSLLWLLISITAFSEYIEELNGFLAPDDSALKRAVNHVCKGSNKIQFWIIPDSKICIEYWIGLGKKINVLMSQGALSKLTEAELVEIYETSQALQKTSKLRWSGLLRQDVQSLNRAFLKIKGNLKNFRFWFVTFWLLPFEKALKFSSRLL